MTSTPLDALLERLVDRANHTSSLPERLLEIEAAAAIRELIVKADGDKAAYDGLQAHYDALRAELETARKAIAVNVREYLALEAELEAAYKALKIFDPGLNSLDSLAAREGPDAHS